MTSRKPSTEARATASGSRTPTPLPPCSPVPQSPVLGNAPSIVEAVDARSAMDGPQSGQEIPGYAVTPKIGGGGEMLHIWLPSSQRDRYGSARTGYPICRTLCGQDANTHWGGYPDNVPRRRRSHVPIAEALAWASIPSAAIAAEVGWAPDPRPTWRWCAHCVGRYLERRRVIPQVLAAMVEGRI